MSAAPFQLRPLMEMLGDTVGEKHLGVANISICSYYINFMMLLLSQRQASWHPRDLYIRETIHAIITGSPSLNWFQKNSERILRSDHWDAPPNLSCANQQAYCTGGLFYKLVIAQCIYRVPASFTTIPQANNHTTRHVTWNNLWRYRSLTAWRPRERISSRHLYVLPHFHYVLPRVQIWPLAPYDVCRKSTCDTVVDTHHVSFF